MTTSNDTAWEQAIAEQAGEDAPLSGLQEGEMLSTSTDEFATRVSSLRYQGYVPYWDAKTGDYNRCPNYMRWQISQITNEDGSQKYTFTNPQIKPDYGLDLFCPLNPDSPEHYIVASMGFPPCRKKHIPHEDGVSAHLQRSHKRAFEALQRSRETTERDEDRELQQQMLQSNQELIQTLAGQVATQRTSVAVEEKAQAVMDAVCDKCGRDFTKSTRQGTLAALRGHKAHCKGASS
jgi:hypothetical protein